MPERTIRAPSWDQEYGKAEECAAFVGIDRRTWIELVAARLIPKGARRSRESAFWHWTIPAAVSLLLPHLMERLAENPVKRKSRKKLSDTRPPKGD